MRIYSKSNTHFFSQSGNVMGGGVIHLNNYHGAMIAVEPKLDGVINMMRCYLSFYVVLYRLMHKIL